MLFRYQVRKLKGAFQRAYGIHAGAALVKVCGLKNRLTVSSWGLCDITCSHWSRVVKHPPWEPLSRGGGGGAGGGGDETGIGVACDYSRHSSLSTCAMRDGSTYRRNKV